MSENRDKNASSHLNPLLSSGGVTSYGAGLGVLTAHPGAAGRYVAYYGSDGKRVAIAESAREAIRKAGMTLVEVPRQAQPIAPGQPGYARHLPHWLGNNAVIDAAQELRAAFGGRISDVQMGLSGRGLSKNMQPNPNGKGSTQIDLGYRRWHPWSGNINFADEIKAANELNGQKVADQAARHGKFIAEHKALSAKPRLVGTALRNAGPVMQVGGALLDYHLTQQEVERELAQGNTRGAGLAEAGFWGRQAGGVLGGAAAGAMLFGGAGALGGSVVPGVGTVALGTGGVLAGGIAGSLIGEEAIKRLYEQWMSTLPSSDTRKLARAPTSQHANVPLYTASEPTSPPSEHDAHFWEWGLR